MHFSFNVWDNVLFESGSRRVKWHQNTRELIYGDKVTSLYGLDARVSSFLAGNSFLRLQLKLCHSILELKHSRRKILFLFLFWLLIRGYHVT